MAGNDFLLPSELGWDANDEISQLIDKWFEKLSIYAAKDTQFRLLFEAAKAELMDDIYAVINKYQEKKSDG